MNDKMHVINHGEGWDSMAKAIDKISVFPDLHGLSGAKIGRWMLITEASAFPPAHYLIIHCGDELRVLYVDEANNSMIVAKS